MFARLSNNDLVNQLLVFLVLGTITASILLSGQQQQVDCPSCSPFALLCVPVVGLLKSLPKQFHLGLGITTVGTKTSLVFAASGGGGDDDDEQRRGENVRQFGGAHKKVQVVVVVLFGLSNRLDVVVVVAAIAIQLLEANHSSLWRRRSVRLRQLSPTLLPLLWSPVSSLWPPMASLLHLLSLAHGGSRRMQSQGSRIEPPWPRQAVCLAACLPMPTDCCKRVALSLQRSHLTRQKLTLGKSATASAGAIADDYHHHHHHQQLSHLRRFPGSG